MDYRIYYCARYVLGGSGFIAPSDKLTKAVIGVGDMGRNHFPYDGTQVVAICEHPGLLRDNGHIGFLGHGSPVQFRNIRIKDLSKR